MQITEFAPAEKLSRNAWLWVLAEAVASIVLGVLILLWPGATVLVAAGFFGAYLIISGILQLVFSFGTHASGSARVLAFISGALSVILGVFCFRSALQSIVLLALWIGIGWMFRGIALVVAAASDPAMPARGWQIALGVLNALAGVVLIVSPLESTLVLAVLGGITLIVLGVTEAVTAFGLRRITRADTAAPITR
jgi:uncharacterized membrane protein HdeD (DUF308 family)